MTLEEWKAIADVTSNFVTAFGIVVGGGWALWKFGIQRKAHPKIEFDLELNILGKQTESLIVEVIAKVTNKGLVRHWLRDFSFDLLYLPKDQPIQLGDERINMQVLFTPVFKKRYWIPSTWLETFIDPGICQRYTYVASAPANAVYLLVFAQFKYPDSKSAFHTAQKGWAVNSHESDANQTLNADAGDKAARAG